MFSTEVLLFAVTVFEADIAHFVNISFIVFLKSGFVLYKL